MKAQPIDQVITGKGAGKLVDFLAPVTTGIGIKNKAFMTRYQLRLSES